MRQGVQSALQAKLPSPYSTMALFHSTSSIRIPLSRRLISCRFSSTTTTPPSATLSRLRADLKSAMQTKDKPRLAVLRTLLAEITNASKTGTPVTNDISLLNLLRKRSATVQQSITQFRAADREDLVAAEAEQLRVLDGYAEELKPMGDGEIEAELLRVVEGIRAAEGEGGVTTAQVMKTCVAPGGPFDGRIVTKADIARVARKVLQK